MLKPQKPKNKESHKQTKSYTKKSSNKECPKNLDPVFLISGVPLFKNPNPRFLIFAIFIFLKNKNQCTHRLYVLCRRQCAFISWLRFKVSKEILTSSRGFISSLRLLGSTEHLYFFFLKYSILSLFTKIIQLVRKVCYNWRMI